MRTSTESGTHNVVLTTAYGWALRQANSTLVSFPPHSPSPPPDLMFFSCWPLPSPSPQSPSPSIHSVNNTQRNYTGVNPQRHAMAKPEKRIEAKPENQGGVGHTRNSLQARREIFGGTGARELPMELRTAWVCGTQAGAPVGSVTGAFGFSLQGVWGWTFGEFPVLPFQEFRVSPFREFRGSPQRTSGSTLQPPCSLIAQSPI